MRTLTLIGACLVLGLGCVPPGEAISGLSLPELAAASLVEVSPGGAPVVRGLNLEDGSLPGPISVARVPAGPRFLVAVETTALDAWDHRVDRARTAEARIKLRDRTSCTEEGDIENGALSFSLDERARVFELSGGVASELRTPSERPSWLAGLHVETPALPEPQCEGAPTFELVRVFAEEEMVPRGATLNGSEINGREKEIVDLHVLSDGRIVAASSFHLVLRHPSEPYRDDPSMIVSTRGREINPIRARAGLVLASEDGQGGGELWFVSTSSEAARYLESIRFDASGLFERRRRSTINPPEDASPEPYEGTGDVTRLLRLPSGALVAVTHGGAGRYAPGPDGPWSHLEVGAEHARVLELMPGETDLLLTADVARVYSWRVNAETSRVSRIGEFLGYEIFGGFAERSETGGLRLTVAGSRGLLATKEGLEDDIPWTQHAVEVPYLGSGAALCARLPVCGRSWVSVPIWDARPARFQDEPWLVLGLDGCSELALVRQRDGCPIFTELVGGVPDEVAGRSTRRVLERGGRWFRLASSGLIRELVVR